MATIVDQLPFDVWIALSFHLPVQSILNLGYTCNVLFALMQERTIWSIALLDILDVIPLAAVRAAMPSMSSQELRKITVRIFRINRLFDSDVVLPANVRCIPCDPQAKTVEIVSGGQVLAIIHQDGTLKLHETTNISSSLLTRPRADYSSDRLTPTDFRLPAPLMDGKLLALVCEYYIGPHGEPLVRYLVYHMDIHVPYLQPVTTVITPSRDCDYTLKHGLLATGWGENGLYLVNVRKVSCSPNEEEAEVVLNLGPATPITPVTHILCSHQILVSFSGLLQLYDIPKLNPIREGIPPQVVDVTPLATYPKSLTNEPKLLWDLLCSHHEETRLSTVAESQMNHWFDLVILPRPGQPEDAFIRHGIGLVDFGPSRAIWDKPGPLLELCSCAQFTRADNHVGYLRLGLSRAPDPSRLVSIPVGQKAVVINDLAWDEQSGLVVLLVTNWRDGDSTRQSKSLIMIDLM